MIKLFKRLIRYLYWKYAHKGDSWQTKLVVYHLQNATRITDDKDPIPEKVDWFFGQINDKMEGVAHVQIRDKFANLSGLNNQKFMDSGLEFKDD